MTMLGQNFEMYQGESKDIQVTVTDNAGSAKDMTGSTLEWYAFSKDTDETSGAKISKTGASITLNNQAGTNDRADFSITPADTASLDVTVLYHELRGTDTGGKQAVLMTGNLSLKSSPSGRD